MPASREGSTCASWPATGGCTRTTSCCRSVPGDRPRTASPRPPLRPRRPPPCWCAAHLGWLVVGVGREGVGAVHACRGGAVTADVVMVFDPPQPCTCCGQPAVWH